MDRIVLPNDVLLNEVAQLLGEGREVVITPKGRSMLPFIRGDVDQVKLRHPDCLKEGDIVRIRGRGEEGQTEYKGTLRDTWIYVEDFSQYMMTANCSIDPGMSGCGLYDENGALIGIACGGNEENVLTAVPLHVVMAELENLRPPS